MSQKNKRKFLKPLNIIVSSLLAVSTPLAANALISSVDSSTIHNANLEAYQSTADKKDLLLVQRTNAKSTKVDYFDSYSHSSHSSHSSHASHYSSSR